MSTLAKERKVAFKSPPSSSLSSSDELEMKSGQVTPSSTSSIPSYRQARNYKVYYWRWFLLLSLCLLNASNGMMWLSFAPIPNYTAKYYNIETSDVDWFSVIYFIVSLLVGFVSIAVLDTFGLRVSLYLGAVFNLSGAIIRYISTVHPIVCSGVFDKSGFLVAMVGQFLTACAQPFMLYAPTKLASFWFKPNERAICTNFASIANPIGLAVAQLASPYIVTSTDRIPMMLWIYTIPAGVAFVLTVIAYWWNKPPLPPTPTSEESSDPPPFFKGLWKTVTNWSFWILLAVWGGGAGLFNALLTLLPQIVCPFGYPDTDSGLWGALMIFCGLVGATIAGLLIDYTKWFKEIAAVALCFAILCLVWFTEVSMLHNQQINIGFSLCMFGFFALPLIPACMELGVEITYPVAEATSSGLLWSMAQVVGIALVFLGQALQTDLSPGLVEHAQCQTRDSHTNSNLPCSASFYNSSNSSSAPTEMTPKDFSHALLLYLFLMATLFILFVIAFQPKYRRVEAEKKANFEESVCVQRKD